MSRMKAMSMSLPIARSLPSVSLASLRSRINRRVITITIVTIFLLSLLASFHSSVRSRIPLSLDLGSISEDEKDMTGGTLRTPPPQYEAWTEAERALPQHNLDLPYPEGRTGKYVKFSNQIKALGWNNVFNEMYVPRQHLSHSILPFILDGILIC